MNSLSGGTFDALSTEAVVAVRRMADSVRLVSEKRSRLERPGGQVQEPLREGTLLLQPRLRCDGRLARMSGRRLLAESAVAAMGAVGKRPRRTRRDRKSHLSKGERKPRRVVEAATLLERVKRRNGGVTR